MCGQVVGAYKCGGGGVAGQVMEELISCVVWLFCFVENLFPNAEPVTNAKNRLCSYRQMVFWCWPGIRRKERRPLPSCLVAYIRAKFPPTDNEEQFADFVWKDFSYGDESEGLRKQCHIASSGCRFGTNSLPKSPLWYHTKISVNFCHRSEIILPSFTSVHFIFSMQCNTTLGCECWIGDNIANGILFISLIVCLGEDE